jgi:hypothetical protein
MPNGIPLWTYLDPYTWEYIATPLAPQRISEVYNTVAECARKLRERSRRWRHDNHSVLHSAYDDRLALPR